MIWVSFSFMHQGWNYLLRWQSYRHHIWYYGGIRRQVTIFLPLFYPLFSPLMPLEFFWNCSIRCSSSFAHWGFLSSSLSLSWFKSLILPRNSFTCSLALLFFYHTLIWGKPISLCCSPLSSSLSRALLLSRSLVWTWVPLTWASTSPLIISSNLAICLSIPFFHLLSAVAFILSTN